MNEKLAEWLRMRNMTPGDFSVLLIGVRNRSVVHRYLRGQVPKPETMERIILLTGGFVQPNDFYPITATGNEKGSINNNTRKQKNEIVRDIPRPPDAIRSLSRTRGKR